MRRRVTGRVTLSFVLQCKRGGHFCLQHIIQNTEKSWTMSLNEAMGKYHGPGQVLPGCIHIPAESSQPLSDCLCWTSWFSHPAECRDQDVDFYDSSHPDRRIQKNCQLLIQYWVKTVMCCIPVLPSLRVLLSKLRDICLGYLIWPLVLR